MIGHANENHPAEKCKPISTGNLNHPHILNQQTLIRFFRNGSGISMGNPPMPKMLKGIAISNGGKQGVPLRDVWNIPYLNPKAKERTGYPTQKPLLLLERILTIASNEGDLALDPFCGSGTTVVAAKLLNRRSIGIDISEEAVALSRTRLNAPIRTESALLQKGRKQYRDADQAALAMLAGLDFAAVQRNKGIDAIMKDSFLDGPIPIRVQRPYETIVEAGSKLHRAARTKNARVMLLIAIQEGVSSTLQINCLLR